MYVNYYTYKVEFQDRGAGHIHGTLWLRLDKIENLIEGKNRTLRQLEEGEQLSEDEIKEKCPFTGLTSAFKKFRQNETLDDTETSAVTRFVDEYTTVCIHGNTVGREVARIAQEVNKHHHTNTCRKHDTTCRFKYPRYPAPESMIVKPCRAESQEAKEALLAK